jgi:hypothetical protein
MSFQSLIDITHFNETSDGCCAKIPGLHDSVFHFRNYELELPARRAYDMGFAELSPTQVATELFANLYNDNDNDNEGTSNNHTVQITTRMYNQKACNYAKALMMAAPPSEDSHIYATVVTDQSAVQDFCFLMKTQKELAGSARSTFVLWAALLGNTTRARLYHVDNQGLRQRHPDYWERFSYNFTHPRLRDCVTFELYHAADDE